MNEPAAQKSSGVSAAARSPRWVVSRCSSMFIVQNTEDVRFHFLMLDFTWPLWLYTIVVALVGALVWFGLGVMRRHNRRKDAATTADDLQRGRNRRQSAVMVARTLSSTDELGAHDDLGLVDALGRGDESHRRTQRRRAQEAHLEPGGDERHRRAGRRLPAPLRGFPHHDRGAVAVEHGRDDAAVDEPEAVVVLRPRA